MDMEVPELDLEMLQLKVRGDLEASLSEFGQRGGCVAVGDWAAKRRRRARRSGGEIVALCSPSGRSPSAVAFGDSSRVHGVRDDYLVGEVLKGWVLYPPHFSPCRCLLLAALRPLLVARRPSSAFHSPSPAAHLPPVAPPLLRPRPQERSYLPPLSRLPSFSSALLLSSSSSQLLGALHLTLRAFLVANMPSVALFVFHLIHFSDKNPPLSALTMLLRLLFKKGEAFDAWNVLFKEMIARGPCPAFNHYSQFLLER
ncbi:hypothetical protein J5N97_030072 [Dioscorea zingiberensis]|uniref:Pentatricopeptide repeat-containing protein n=1 Tax=Dioscorea zingiberensis TaxID=325984 RepID=A0A9D5BWZ7_9LILI|nr:hypothetical protein J5N97_030072 [Dioscorea zingiberensis]